METFVLMIFILINPDFSGKSSQSVVMHSVYGFDSEFSCEKAYEALAPSGFGMTINHACRAVTLTQKMPDPLFVIPLAPVNAESVKTKSKKQ